jgi:hypothetical protein
MVGNDKNRTQYIFSIILIILTSIYLAVFSGYCQKMTAGCVPMNSTLCQLTVSGIGIAIGFIVAIVFTFLKPLLCSWPNGVGTILFMVIVSGILIIGPALSMHINNLEKDKSNKQINPNDKLTSILLNNVLFLSIAVGIIYSILMNLISISVGRKPILILSLTLIPIAIYTIVIGSMVLNKYNNVKNDDKICTKYPIDPDIDLSGIASIIGTNNNPPYGTTLGMIIGAGIFLFLISITLYFTKGKM